MNAAPPTTESDVLLAAHRFADVLRRTVEWQAWTAANEALAADSDVAALAARIDALGDAWQSARRSGTSGPGGEELASLQRQFREHPAMVAQQRATEELVALLRQANGFLSARLDLDFAETAARAGGACCAA